MDGATIRRSRREWRQAAPLVICLLSLGFQASAAKADAPWHADLATARAAAASSHKPVFAVFTASWSPESTAFEQQALASAEAVAVIAACFEPVRIDVDQRPGLTKRLQIAHVPSACVLGNDDAVLTRFDCPPTAAAFVAAVARSAQEAAVAAAGSIAAPAADAIESSSLVTDARGTTDLSASGFPTTKGDGGPLSEATAADSSGRGSISLVKAKVQQLSTFATTDANQAPTAVTPAPAMAVTEPPPSRFVSASPVDTPALPKTPPAWPAEPTPAQSAFTNTSPPQTTASRPIEPSSSPAATPWLASGSAAPASPEASASASDLPASAKPASTWSSFVTAFQKPFNVFAKPTKASEPPTLPPARPSSPLESPPAAAVATTAVPSIPDQATAPATPDPYGSMPLGLEGYCPVTLAERGVWTEGRAQWGARHRGRTYLFAGPEQQQAFLASPDRYSPALSGDDPVAVVEHGKSTPGRRAYGVTYQSRMYLFSSAETRAQFAANPERYTATAILAERPAPVDATRRY